MNQRFPLPETLKWVKEFDKWNAKRDSWYFGWVFRKEGQLFVAVEYRYRWISDEYPIETEGEGYQFISTYLLLNPPTKEGNKP